MTAATYQSEQWFSLLEAAASRTSQLLVAAELGVSQGTVSQVLRGTGLYGTGKASTVHIARRVLDTYSHWECPFLSDDEPRTVTSAECRAFAHRPAPTSSPRNLAHWRACQQCPMKARSAPPVARPHKPRPRHPASASHEGEGS